MIFRENILDKNSILTKYLSCNYNRKEKKEVEQMKNYFKFILLFIFIFTCMNPNQKSLVFANIDFESLGYSTIAQRAGSQESVFEVIDYSVIDGDTADFILDRKTEPSIKARFLLIDVPELRGGVPYSKAAKKRVSELLSQADLIEVEYEGPEKDKYGRDLVHVWVDGILLEEIMVREGYAIARYIQAYLPNSPYAEAIYAAQDQAKYEGVRVWVDGDINYINQAEYLNTNASTASNQVNFTDPILNEDVYYKNCKEVKAAGKAPIYPGDPGFRPQFDRDNDGIGCEV